MDAMQEQTPQAQEDWEEADGQNIQADQEDTHQIESVDEEDPVEETKHDNKSQERKNKDNTFFKRQNRLYARFFSRPRHRIARTEQKLL